MTQNSTLVSRHLTSEGVVLWTRCSCGRLRMDLVPHGDAPRLTAGPCPHAAGGRR
ncbi:hypothetical protein HUT06_29525 [Actinomadura sp. NAK00032]|uniref:hypothetical protein n=1 Tax=Actinomadura sp. NAK00032 TaxID=2742128 RepID=UPI0015928770|nr:hypothetical protein [Actinomadura sp. NAK00032]QKW37640.1 hypothetical protein HUT06_29525 [Actinomadura sp. NAK00032]